MPAARRKLLDSFAVLALLNEEAGHGQVEALLRTAERTGVPTLMNAINVGEVDYIQYKERSPEEAEEAMDWLAMLPIEIVHNSFPDVMAAARLKALHPIAYADAFAAATALRLQATLVTGDPEFGVLGDQLDILWLPAS